VSPVRAGIEGEYAMIDVSIGHGETGNPRRNSDVPVSRRDVPVSRHDAPTGRRGRHPLTAPPNANPPPSRRAISTYSRITGVE